MGIFDDMFGGGKSKELTKQEGFAGILISAVCSDGFISDEESRGMCTALARMKLFDGIPDEKMGNMLNKLISIIKKEGAEEAMRRFAKSVAEELKKTAFANACDLVLADGEVDDDEKELITNLWKTLGISGDDAKTIAQVMVLKNKG